MSDQAVPESSSNYNTELLTNQIMTVDDPSVNTNINSEDDDIIIVTKQSSLLYSDIQIEAENEEQEEEVMEIDQNSLNNSPDVQIISENNSSKKVVSVSSTWVPAVVDPSKIYLKEPRCQVCSKGIVFDPETIYWEMMLFCRSKCFESYNDLLSSSNSFRQSFGLNSIGNYCLENRDSVAKYIKNHEELSNNKLAKAYLDLCVFCSNKRPVEEELILIKGMFDNEIRTKIAKFCGSTCFSQFKKNNSLETFKCDFCSTSFVRDCSDHTIFYNATSKSFCSKLCLAVYFTKFRKKVRCNKCEKVEKHNFNMIERIPSDGFSRYYCSIKCLYRTPKVRKRAMKSSIIAYPKPGMPVIESVSSLALCNESAPKPPQQPKPVVMKEVIRHPLIKCFDGVSVKNKIVVAKPYLKDAEASCQVDIVEESTQTDYHDESYSSLYPITVPFYMPLPLRMYSCPTPVPMPVPVCVPVPVFIPIESGSLERIKEKINDLKTKFSDNEFISTSGLLESVGCPSDSKEKSFESESSEEKRSIMNNPPDDKKDKT